MCSALSVLRRRCYSFFFFNDTATTEIYTLSLHDALPISIASRSSLTGPPRSRSKTASMVRVGSAEAVFDLEDRKSTRLNSSHSQISYAVFCLKKKKIEIAKPRPESCLGTAQETETCHLVH